MTTLNEEYKGRVTYCSHLTSVVCELLDLIFSSEITWQIETKHDMILMFIEWFSKKNLCCCFKRGRFHIIYGFKLFIVHLKKGGSNWGSYGV
jgi:hypothetical protein